MSSLFCPDDGLTDDVWGSADENDHISSQAPLKREHFKNGYRDGITETKEEALQLGFDDGYPVGAVIGQQVGLILGTLQGLGLRDLEKAAHVELAPENLFSDEYWNVKTEKLYMGDVHPLVGKWQATLEKFNSSSATLPVSVSLKSNNQAGIDF